VGQKSQFQVKLKQKEKRKSNRKKLVAKGEDVNKFYYGKYYIQSFKTKSA